MQWLGINYPGGLISPHPAFWSMEQIVKSLKKPYLTSKLLLSLYYYIISSSSYIYQGYRECLGEFTLAGADK